MSTLDGAFLSSEVWTPKVPEEENVIIYGGVASYVGRDRADMIWLFDRAGGSLTQENQAKFPPNELTSSMVWLHLQDLQVA
ncbi:unnamed protein product [Clonostachys rosea f. rosea IK726]|uniref:Uncharacterized protein n=1 Tax=Clonostachys rosea f. rosea IK726 TaxID=1349383 RepID=A0ACA9UB88_BIOOC|nr:unnamed protein product [Clonostachys rosea f. rosea IK726]